MADVELVIKIPKEEYEMIMLKMNTSVVAKSCSEAEKLIANSTPLPKCKHCKHFERDVVALVDGIPLIVGHEMCNKWGNGCKTQEDGYCFLFEPIEN